MFIANKKITTSWTKIDEVGDGNTFFIQPLYNDISYIVLDEEPTTQREGIVKAKDQLVFKKISGDLWLKDIDGLASSLVAIEQSEA